MFKNLLKKNFIEIIGLLIIFLVCFHLYSERINHTQLPDGDQGSWMAVAKEFSLGNGFTTSWYEHPFLKPDTLPRPDDYRFPGLVIILGFSFKIFGISYKTALWTCFVIFLIYLFIIYLCCRKVFSKKTAFLTVIITTFSLLQLYWNSKVYSEALFGIVVGLIILWTSLFTNKKKISFWIILGVLCGLLYNIRPNGIIFIFGIIWLYFREKKIGIKISMPIISVLFMFLIMLPWLIRNYILFGNAFHVAANAGLFHLTYSENPLSFKEFIIKYSPLVFIFNTIKGIFPFLIALNFFEHGLFVIPFFGVLLGFYLKKPFYNSFIIINFVIMLLACFYISGSGAGSWSGVRYYSMFLPFIYAYGINSFLILIEKINNRKIFYLKIKNILTFLFCVFLLLPVYFPHKYYERYFRKTPKSDLSFFEHLKTMNSIFEKKETYLANKLCQLNFLTCHYCVGIQEYVDSVTALNLINKFSPKFIILTKDEMKEKRIRSIINEIEKNNFKLSLKDTSKYGYYFKIEK